MESAEENGNEMSVSNSYFAPITSSPPSQTGVMSTTGTPMKLVPIHRLYKDTTSTTEDFRASIANGFENAKVSSGKGKARKLVEANKSKGLTFPYVNKIEKSMLVYSRRRKKGAIKSNAHMCNGSGSQNVTFSDMDNSIGSPRKSNTQIDSGVGSPKNPSAHIDNGIASTPTVPFAERLIQLTKLKQDRQTLDNDNNGNVHKVGRPDGELGSRDVVMEDTNTLDIVDGGEDEVVVQCDGSDGGVGLKDIESADHDGTGLLKKSHSYVNDRSGNGSGWMKRKKPQKSTFEGIDLFPDKRRKLDDRVWLRERGTRMQHAAKLASNWNLQSVKRRESLPASVTKSETRGREQIATSNKRKWIEVGITEVNPMALLEYTCKVYWPLDDKWYSGVIDQYDAKNKKHHVNYIDGQNEWLLLVEEKLKLFVSGEEMQKLHLKNKEQMRINEMMNNLDYDEMAALAATMDDYQGEPGHGDLIWAKITGHSMWPAFVMDEPHANACDGLEPATREGSIPLQFFGSYDYARINSKQIMPFYRGFQRNLQSKNRTLVFLRALREAWRYLKELKLPEAMSKLQMQVVNAGSERENERNSEQSDGDEDCMGDERSEKIKKSVECLFSCPIVTGGLRVLSLGKIVKDSEHFHDEHHIWTEGYIVIRKFTSIKGPGRYAEYKMEVLRNPLQRNMPLFRITLEDGAEIDGSTPTECWKKIYARLEKSKRKISNGLKALEKRRPYKSGSYMFGFSNKRIASLIQALPHARACSKYMDWDDKLAVQNNDEVLPAGYRPVNVQWKDLDRCSVCHMEEEYVNNVFLQCDKCRMMVHANCYGELEPVDGKLWHCKLCRSGAPKRWPACCLCPITGGAMKKTTCGRWAHLTCATWIPETCLVDIKRMEPIDGVNRISKDRWKLICSICEVPYGACIQCSEHNCRVAYHPLCARAAGLCVEVLEDKRARHTGSTHEECEQLRLLSFCKKHRQPTDERSPTDQEGSLAIRDCSAYVPPSNPSGCARCEPYNFSERRGRKEPEAASIKRLFVENRPYLVSGCRRNGPWADIQGNGRHGMESADQNTSRHQVDGLRNFISDKYDHMRATFKKRLAFGKSGIHGFGIFAKLPHKAGDMVIEYTGEIVRPIIADIREHFIYNSLVGAGTYMFRIDDERVIDATRVGSIAHLINHSCEPNCYSRAINVCGEDRIIIFAKRDIKQWEELTYDYRFFSIDEQLACYCGFPRCRGIVNINDEEQVGTISVPRRELTEWTPDDGE